MRRTLLWLPVAALMVNAFTWGVSWWPLRQLQDAGLHPLWATVLIYALAVALIVALGCLLPGSASAAAAPTTLAPAGTPPVGEFNEAISDVLDRAEAHGCATTHGGGEQLAGAERVLCHD